MEEALDHALPFMDSKIAAMIFGEQKDLQLGSRFFLWAIRKELKLNNVVEDVLVKVETFDVYWKTIEEMRSLGTDIGADAFTVLISEYWRMGMAEKAVEMFGRMKEFECQPDVYTYVEDRRVFGSFTDLSCSPNVVIYNILIDGSKTGRILMHSDAARAIP